MAEEYLNTEALERLPEGVQEVLRYIIRKFRPIFLYLYPEGWDVLDTGDRYQALIIVDEDPSGEERLALLHEINSRHLPFAYEFMERGLLVGRLRYGSTFLDAVLHGQKQGGRLIYARDPLVFKWTMGIYEKQRSFYKVARLGDSLSPQDWAYHAERFFVLAEIAEEKMWGDIAAFLFFQSSEIALKALILLYDGDPMGFRHDVNAMAQYVDNATGERNFFTERIKTLLSVQQIHIRRYPQGDGQCDDEYILGQLKSAALDFINYSSETILGRKFRGGKLGNHLSGPGGKRKGPLDDFIVCPPSS